MHRVLAALLVLCCAGAIPAMTGRGTAMAAANSPSAASKVAAKPEAVCVVCRVKEGKSEPEAVKTLRTYRGREYALCSAACTRAFDADPEAFIEPVLPRPAPEFSVRDLDGGVIGLATLRGKTTLLDFWATWCLPCVRNAPELDRLHRGWGARGFQVLGVSIDEGGAKKVRSFASRHPVSYPLAVDSEKPSAWQSFRVKAVPAAFLLDAQGRIVRQWLGSVDPKEVEQALASLLADSLQRVP